MSINWAELKTRFDQISRELAASSLDQQARIILQKEASQLSQLLDKYHEIEQFEQQLQKNRQELEHITDPDMRMLYQEEIDTIERQKIQLEQELEDLLYPADELDTRSIFLEIRAGTGGAEAALFAADLMKMYTNYALKKGWQVSIADLSETDLGGIREVTLHIEGKDVYKHLKREAGVHRVQRVPQTETQGRVHTSTATVAVLPETETEVEVSINPQDLRIDTYRSGGAGGQHVNKTDSAVRITHIPSGIVVACQEERSQHKNKAKAMKMLQARLLAAQREKQEQAIGKERKKMVGTGVRAEKVRTYNYPQNRITDHQIDLTLKKLDIMMTGDLDDIIEPLIEYDRQERRKLQQII